MSSGLVLIDKPQGWTSHDVVAKMRGILGTRKVGHAGTLDPMATGLLILGVNSGTKLLQYLLGKDKTYAATVRLGQTTLSDDADGEIMASVDASGVTDEQIDAEISKLTGPISQLPSSVSAKKVDGKRAYDLVREGKEVNLEPKAVEIYSFERVGPCRRVGELVDFDVVVRCSTGTYVRALARDIGSSLKVGGHLTALRRTQIDGFDLAQATSMTVEPVLIDLESAATKLFPGLEVGEQEVIDIRHGKRVKLESEDAELALTKEGSLVALVSRIGSEYKSMAVFEVEA